MLKTRTLLCNCILIHLYCRKTLFFDTSAKLRVPPGTISIAMVRNLLEGIHAHGEACDVYLADAGIEPDLLEEPGGYVTVEQYGTLIRSLMSRRNDEGCGFLRRRLKRGTFTLLIRSTLWAEDLETAIRYVARTLNLLQDDVEIKFVRAHDLAGVALKFASSDIKRTPFFDESFLRVLWRLLAWLIGGSLPVMRFDFEFDIPPHVGNYERIFPAELHFSQTQSAFWFDAKRLKSRVRQDEVTMRSFVASSPLAILLPERSDRIMTIKVRQYLQDMMPAWPDFPTTADALHISTSTLQRRLAAEGTSFLTLKDTLRRDIAITRLSTSNVPIIVLAQELGFADSATFQRAFKMWTGSPPGKYRRGEI